MVRSKKIEARKQPPLTISQRAMAAARRMKDLVLVAHQRQKAGINAPEGTKGKASAHAAAEQGIGPRIVELARLVHRSCVPEVVAAVESGKIKVAAAAKLAKALPQVQRQAIAEVIKGRSAVEVLAEIGVQDRRLPRFDDDVLEQMVNQFKRLINLRRATVGDHPCYHAAYKRLDELRSTVRQWSLSGPHGAPRQYTDRYGQLVPEQANWAFRFRGEIENTCYDITALIRRIGAMSCHDGGQCIPAKQIATMLEQARCLLLEACPYEVCTCRGTWNGHEACGGRGWLPKRRALPSIPSD